MPKTTIYLDSFTTLDEIPRNERTYDVIKATALKAGQFSVFDAYDAHMGKLLTALMQDPEIEEVPMGYPWTGVRLRSKEDADAECKKRRDAKAVTRRLILEQYPPGSRRAVNKGCLCNADGTIDPRCRLHGEENQ